MSIQKKPRRGRPEKPVKATARIELRVFEKQKEQWQKAATNAGYKTLAAWLKALGDKHSNY